MFCAELQAPVEVDWIGSVEVLSASLKLARIPEEICQMNQEAVQQSYRGVRCMSCRQPIPLPNILIEMDSRLRGLSSERADEHCARVFSLRCRACEREKPYRASDIEDFEGEPRVRVSRSEFLGVASSLRARAANG
jgi:hypothetical protein